MKLGNQVSIFALALALTASTAALADDATTDTTTAPVTTDPALAEPAVVPEAPAGSDVTVVDVESGTAAPAGTLADTPFASMTSDDLIGKAVVNSQGETIGEIEDVVLDSNQKAIYAVLSVGGFLGIGSKSVAIPFDQLQIGEDEATLMSSVTEDQLSEMAEYAADAYAPMTRDAPLGDAFPAEQATLDAQDTAPTESEMQSDEMEVDATAEVDATQTEDGALQAGADIDITTDIEPAAGTEATTAETSDQPAVDETIVAEDTTAAEVPAADESSVARESPFAEMTAKELIGKDVVNTADEDVGEITNLVISDDKAVQAVISVGGFLGIGEKDVAVPLDELQVTEDEAVLKFGLSKEDLEAMPAYDEATWPALEGDQPVYQQ